MAEYAPMNRIQALGAAKAHIEAGRFREAHGICMALLRADPRDADAYSVLGLIAFRNQVYDKAADLFGRASTLAPSVAEHWVLLARCQLGLNRASAVSTSCSRALDLAPADPEILDQLGVILTRIGRHADALNCFESAVEGAPKSSNYWTNLGWGRQFAGDLSGAEAAYRMAVSLDWKAERAHLALVQIARQTEADNAAPALERLFEEAGADGVRKLHLGHALAKTMEDLGQYERSMAWLGRAKAARLAGGRAAASGIEPLFEAAGNLVKSSGPDVGPPTGPVFVLGLPRSGTTLVDRIISSHSKMTSLGEPMTFALQARRLAPSPAEGLLDAAALKAADLTPVGSLGQAYISASREAAGGLRFVDKTPLNLLFNGLIVRALPESRIICLRRHPVASCLAIYKNLFAADFQHYAFTADLESTARYVVAFNRFADQCRAALDPEQYTEVRYEDILADQEGVSRRLLSFCGLDWEDACLRFEHNAAPVATASSIQVRQPLYQSSRDRWRDFGETLEPALTIFRSAGLIDDDGEILRP